MGGLTLFRWWYYGSLVPNTYLVKVALIPAGVRILNGILLSARYFYFNLIAILLLAVFFYKEKGRVFRIRGPFFLLYTLFGASLLYNVYVGGDAWEDPWSGSRFLFMGVVAIFPVMAIILDKFRIAAAVFLGLMHMWGVPFPSLNHYYLRYVYLFDILREGQAEKEYDMKMDVMHANFTQLKAELEHANRIAIDAAGTIPYFLWGKRWLDVLGLCSRLLPNNYQYIKCSAFFTLWFSVYLSGHSLALWPEVFEKVDYIFLFMPFTCERLYRESYSRLRNFLCLLGDTECCRQFRLAGYCASEQTCLRFCELFEPLRRVDTRRFGHLWRRRR